MTAMLASASHAGGRLPAAATGRGPTTTRCVLRLAEPERTDCLVGT